LRGGAPDWYEGALVSEDRDRLEQNEHVTEIIEDLPGAFFIRIDEWAIYACGSEVDVPLRGTNHAIDLGWIDTV
jgi:hypothetical protein